jgi:hypothetical protein
MDNTKGERAMGVLPLFALLEISKKPSRLYHWFNAIINVSVFRRNTG